LQFATTPSEHDPHPTPPTYTHTHTHKNNDRRARVFEMRARSDAVVVGGNTVRRDNPNLTTRRSVGRWGASWRGVGRGGWALFQQGSEQHSFSQRRPAFQPCLFDQTPTPTLPPYPPNPVIHPPGRAGLPPGASSCRDRWTCLRRPTCGTSPRVGGY